MKAAHLSPILLSVVFTACAHSPQPYVFAANDNGRDVDLVVRTLQSNGLQTAEIDRKQGTVTTYWFDTGYRFRETDILNPNQYPTNIFLRYRVSLKHESGKSTVVLDTEVQRCAPLDVTVTASGVRGSCEPMTQIFPAQQKQVDALGEKLREALAGGGNNSAVSG
jgi:hypothetical protein